MKVYPPGQTTRRGCQKLLERVEPLVIYTSHDGGIQWNLNGGMEPMPYVQEGALLEDGVQGLHPAFNPVDLKGARQPGVTTQRIVYDPGEYDLQVEMTAPPNHSEPHKAAAAIRRVIRDWIASWDPEKPGKLVYVTPDGGYWYCTPRLFRPPPDRQFRQQARRLHQKYTWTIRNDDAFWKGIDSVSEFRFAYITAEDLFNRDDDGDLGPQWQQTYTGPGAGTCETDNGRARWFPEGTASREVVNRFLGINEVQTVFLSGEFTGGTWNYTINTQTTAGIAFDASAAAVKSAIEALPGIAVDDVAVTGNAGGPWQITFQNGMGLQDVTSSVSGANLTPGGTTASAQVATTVAGVGSDTGSDNQVVKVNLGTSFQWPFPEDGAFDIWARHNGNDASPTALRLRVQPNDDIFGGTKITISRFNAGVETVIKEAGAFDSLNLLLPPLDNEEWIFEAGTGSTAREYKVRRSGLFIGAYKETGTGSGLGSGFRGTGWGLKVGTGSISQNVPPSVESFSVGDNGIITQSGECKLTNFGDQDGMPRYLVYGPGTFHIANGVGGEMIEFGPLGDNQIVLLTTNPRLRNVVDMSPERPVQDLTIFQEFIDQLIKFAVNNNVPPLLEQFESLLGILPPQGEMYPLLKGRFTASIPAKPTGRPPTPQPIAVQIVDGSSDSKIVAALTPLRRWPE